MKDGSRKTPAEFDEAFMMHTSAIAHKCYMLAKKRYGMDERRAREAFLMGFIRGVAYEFHDISDSYENQSAQLLEGLIRGQGLDRFKMIINAIRFGGEIRSGHVTKYDRILNEAYLTTSPDGSDMNIVDRLVMVENKYGRDSEKYRKLSKLSASWPKATSAAPTATGAAVPARLASAASSTPSLRSILAIAG